MRRGRKRRMLIGMMHFRCGRGERARATRTGRVDVRDAWWDLQVWRSAVVIDGERTRVRRELLRERWMGAAVQMGDDGDDGEGAGMGRGWRSSRLGRRGLLEDDMILLEWGADDVPKAEKKCFWNATPDAPSPRAWW